MKIEIGESLLLSWLRHAKNCQLVQTNWKPSSTSWDLFNEDKMEELMTLSKEYFIEKHDADLYGHTSSYQQLLKQAEIDVIGMSITEDDEHYIYAIDVAFHEAGLNYGGKHVTGARIVKKIIRTAMCLFGFFNIKQGEIIFASPKVNKSFLEILDPYINTIREIMETFDLKFKIRLITNGDFEERVLQPVIASSYFVSDTSELFMRSLQMYSLFRDVKVEKNIIERTRKYGSKEKTTFNKHEDSGEMKIGAYVKSNMLRLFKEKIISQEEINNLLNEKYSKNVFNMNYPVLKKLDKSKSFDKQKKDHNGYNRYWNFTAKKSNSEYLICSQWIESLHRDYFNSWLNNIDNNIDEDLNDIKIGISSSDKNEAKSKSRNDSYDKDIKGYKLVDDPTKIRTKVVSKEKEMKIGRYVRVNLKKLFELNLIPEAEVEKLAKKYYSKNTFNLNYPLLKEIDKTKPFRDQIVDDAGRNRYWSFTVYAYGRYYAICNHWVEGQNRWKFERWLSKYQLK